MREEPVDQEVGLTYEPTISYSVKDILARVEGKLDAALIGVATKAEHADLVKLDGRVRELERIEEGRNKAHRGWVELRRWAIPTLISLAATAAIVIQALHL